MKAINNYTIVIRHKDKKSEQLFDGELEMLFRKVKPKNLTCIRSHGVITIATSEGVNNK